MDAPIAGKFRIIQKLGCGSCGTVFRGHDLQTENEVAIKVEAVDSRCCFLAHESRMYNALAGVDGIPKLHWFGTQESFHVMVLDLLGPSLENLLQMYGGRINLETTLLLADQMLIRLESMHAKGLVHRDVKPENFVMGLGKNAHKLYLIDFGLADRYQSPDTKLHIPYCEGQVLKGTARYVSLNVHRGIVQSRRDDVESVGYVMMYLLRGSLPWQGMFMQNKREWYARIAEKKGSTSIEELCAGYPWELGAYLRYCRALSFEQCPDYVHLRGLLQGLYWRVYFEKTFMACCPQLLLQPLLKSGGSGNAGPVSGPEEKGATAPPEEGAPAPRRSSALSGATSTEEAEPPSSPVEEALPRPPRVPVDLGHPKTYISPRPSARLSALGASERLPGAVADYELHEARAVVDVK